MRSFGALFRSAVSATIDRVLADHRERQVTMEQSLSAPTASMMLARSYLLPVAADWSLVTDLPDNEVRLTEVSGLLR